MRTTDLAKAVGLSTQAVRGYAIEGFLPPVERTARGYRVFTERHLAALKTVRALRQAGYSTRAVQTIMQAVHRQHMETALALVDERHAELHRERCRIATAVDAIHTLMQHVPKALLRPHQRAPLRVGEAAKAVGVRPSAIRFWETQELLQPKRDLHSGYRLYDQRHVRRLEIIALLRGADYGFDMIRVILKELTEAEPEAAMRMVEKRRADITEASKRCAEATAMLWEYVRQEQYLARV